MNTVQQLDKALRDLNDSADALVAAEAALPENEHDLREHFRHQRDGLRVLGKRLRARMTYAEDRL